MAASPIYERAGLVQFGFTNSHPDFTKGGQFTWSNSMTQNDAAPLHADYVADLGLKRIAVLHLNTDWGKTTYDLFAQRAKERGVEIVATEAYLPEKGFPQRADQCAQQQSGRHHADFVLHRCCPAYPADQSARPGRSDRRQRLEPLTQVCRARRGGGRGRVSFIQFFARRSAARSPAVSREIPRQVQRGIGLFRRACLRHDQADRGGHRAGRGRRTAIRDALGKVNDVPSVSTARSPSIPRHAA